jgi:hypothetical protein
MSKAIRTVGNLITEPTTDPAIPGVQLAFKKGQRFSMQEIVVRLAQGIFDLVDGVHTVNLPNITRVTKSSSLVAAICRTSLPRQELLVF